MKSNPSANLLRPYRTGNCVRTPDYASEKFSHVLHKVIPFRLNNSAYDALMVLSVSKYDWVLGAGAVRKGSLSHSLFVRLIAPTGVVEWVSCASLASIKYLARAPLNGLLAKRIWHRFKVVGTRRVP